MKIETNVRKTWNKSSSRILFRILHNDVPRYYVLRFAKKLYAIKPEKWQKGESLETCPSAGLKPAEHDITSRMTPGVDIRTCETLTQNTF